MSISSIVPIKEREEAVQDELRKEGKPVATKELTRRVLKRFASQLTSTELKRVTPSGYLWWPGCIRFDLDRLQKKGKVRSPSKGYWEINEDGISELTKNKLNRLNLQGLNLLGEAVKNAKSGEIPYSISIKGNEFILKLG